MPPLTDAIPADATPCTINDLLAELRRLRAAVEAGPVEGLDAAAYATLIGVSRSKLHELNAHGLVPAPIEVGLGRCPRWSRAECLAHFRAGMPSRSTWLQMKNQCMRRAAG